ncbi:hypothetical protein [Streptomyces sp. NPDC058326]|uniref:hypothetical protein n=1 Tax=Streptomyces sp. NPDC058326 TaxID=3346447 RepID=UPI0036ECF605
MARRPLPTLPAYRKDAVTRKLCAHVHLDEHFAREVDTELTADRMKRPSTKDRVSPSPAGASPKWARPAAR